MKRKNILSKIAVVTLISLIILFGVYKFFFSPITVIPGTQSVLTFYKGFGYVVSSLENEETEIKVGDVIISINNQTIYANTDINEVIESSQSSDEEKILISYIRDETLYETFIDKGVFLGTETFNFGVLTNAYISMIEPNTYRYATDSENPFKYSLDNVFSGYSMESFVSFEEDYNITITSLGNVIGSITNSGEKCVYGYMEPFSFDEDKLVEVARRHQVKDGNAIIEIKTEDNQYFLVDVFLECNNKGIDITLSEKSCLKNIKNIDIPGLPIYQDGKLAGIYMWYRDEKRAFAWYAIDVYKEMMETAK